LHFDIVGRMSDHGGASSATERGAGQLCCGAVRTLDRRGRN